ncbi:hypothetical protein AB6819_09490 [Carnobacterium maltaromaticum]|uniref:hypothetical protein n=1 Tax=Carnobacterium maltaromaticum TaxID=2751 RepID=UPI0039B0A6FE
MSDQKILVQILEQQKKTNELLQAIVSSQEQYNITITSDGINKNDGPLIANPF